MPSLPPAGSSVLILWLSSKARTIFIILKYFERIPCFRYIHEIQIKDIFGNKHHRIRVKQWLSPTFSDRCISKSFQVIRKPKPSKLLSHNIGTFLVDTNPLWRLIYGASGKGFTNSETVVIFFSWLVLAVSVTHFLYADQAFDLNGGFTVTKWDLFVVGVCTVVLSIYGECISVLFRRSNWR